MRSCPFSDPEPDFKTTVLEAYWEFEAQTGTIVKLAVCSFISGTLNFQPTFNFVRKVENEQNIE